MENYKIINTHTNEIIKALNVLGYVWTPKKFDEQDCLLKAHWILAEQSGAITYSSGTMIDYPLEFQELTLPQLRDLVAKSKSEQGLISGADALRALADEKEVEFKCGGSSWRLLNAKQQPLEILIDQTVQFRLKPHTIKLELEIPTPFEPKSGDMVWCLSELSEKGYEARTAYDAEDFITHIAYWRTESEIKQVVAALRGALKNG